MPNYWDINSYDYFLPEDQIAQHPSEKRGESKLLVYSKSSEKITHSVFKNIIDYLKPGDLLVVNNCKVIPARIFAKRADTNAEIEILLTRKEKPGRWVAMVKPGKKCKKGTKLVIGKIEAEVVEIDQTGQRIIEFSCSEEVLSKYLSEFGVIPLPPYIKRIHAKPSTREDRQRYQTVYAEAGRAIAAPTAGLHFSEEILKKIKEKGCEIVSVTLNVGAGTFLPVKCDDVREHKMHSEEFEISSETVEKLNNAKKENRRIIAVGTTSLRVLESSINKETDKFSEF
ncbi:MAG: tRNA preQ1(34) S-adenosylmethionine ribosyltransferase-isomerase QueA, partial [Alphaproteobacteria bacterium]